MHATNGYVLLPQPIEPEAHALFEKRGIETVLAKDPKPETVAPLLGKADSVVLRTGIRFDKELLSNAAILRHVSRTGAGVDNVDLSAATERGVIVTSSVGVNTASVILRRIRINDNSFRELPDKRKSLRSMPGDAVKTQPVLITVHKDTCTAVQISSR